MLLRLYPKLDQLTDTVTVWGVGLEPACYSLTPTRTKGFAFAV